METLLAIEQNEPISQYKIAQSYPQKECFAKVELNTVLPDSTLEVEWIVDALTAAPRHFLIILEYK